MGFIIIGPLLDDPKMAPWGTIFPMGIRDDGGAKIVVTPFRVTVRGNIPLANTKTYY